MKSNKTISDKQLNDLFKQISLDSPSSGFMENLMIKVESEAKKQKWIPFLQMAAGILAIILLPGLYIYFFVPDFFSQISFSPIRLKFDPTITLIGFTVLILLVSDTLFQQYYFSKRK